MLGVVLQREIDQRFVIAGLEDHRQHRSHAQQARGKPAGGEAREHHRPEESDAFVKKMFGETPEVSHEKFTTEDTENTEEALY